jgi:hypothetical protein
VPLGFLVGAFELTSMDCGLDLLGPSLSVAQPPESPVLWRKSMDAHLNTVRRPILAFSLLNVSQFSSSTFYIFKKPLSG